MGKIKKQTIKSTIYAYLGIVLGFISQAWLIPHALSKAEVGLTNNLFAIAIIMVQLAGLGFGNAGVKYFPYFADNNNNHKGFLYLFSKVHLWGFLAICVLLFVGKSLIFSFYHDPLINTYYYAIYIILAATTFFGVFDNFLRCIGNATTGVLLKEFFLRLFIMAAVIALLFGWVNFQTFVILWLIAYTLPTLLAMLKVYVDGNLNFKKDPSFPSPALLKEMTTFSAYTLLTSMSYQIVLYIDKIMVAGYISLADSGVYSISLQFAVVIATPSVALARAFTPMITKAWKENDLAIITEVYRKSCVTQLIIGCLVYLGIVVNLDNVFSILPAGYEAGRWVIIIVGLGKVFDLATGINSIILSNSSYYRYDTAFFVVLIAITVGLNHYLIPIYGINGSAVAGTIATVFFNFFRTAFIYYQFKMQPYSWVNLWVIILAIVTYYLVIQMPVIPSILGIKSFIADTGVRSILVTALFIGSIYVLKIYPFMNQQIRQFISR